MDKDLVATEKNHMKIELKSQQPWTAVLALLGLISMAQMADDLYVPSLLISC